MPILNKSKTLTAMSIQMWIRWRYSTPSVFHEFKMILVLYQRDDCHLCDLAIDILAHARTPEFSSVFIDNDNALEASYGERVPVLREELSGRELNWPFDVAMVNGFVQPV